MLILSRPYISSNFLIIGLILNTDNDPVAPNSTCNFPSSCGNLGSKFLEFSLLGMMEGMADCFTDVSSEADLELSWIKRLSPHRVNPPFAV